MAASSATTLIAIYKPVVCAYSLSGIAIAAVSGGGSATVGVTSQPGCQWNAVSSASWLTVTSGAPANGNGTVSYSIAANPDPAPRSATITIAGQTLTVTQNAAVGLRFVPITPCRVADTRSAPGPFGGPAIGGGQTRDFVLPNSACGIPGNVAAFSLNIAVVPAGPLGYLTAWPAGNPQPLASTLNSIDGRVKSNAAIVPAGPGGAISILPSNATHVVLDINGYFVPATDSIALAFYPVTPCRHRRYAQCRAPLGGPSLVGGARRSFSVLASPCNIPASAKAYSLNLAAVPPGPLGRLTAWPTGRRNPPPPPSTR